MLLRHGLHLFGTTFCVFAFAVAAHAQTAPTQVDSSNATGPTPYASFGGVHENVNLATGDLSLELPLLTLPGRNGHSLSVGLNYDSKIWTLQYMVNPNNPDTWLYFWDQEERMPQIGGWRLSIPVLQAIKYDLGPQGGWSDRSCMEFFIVTMPDGRKAQFTNKAACSHTSSSSGQVSADPASNNPLSDSQEGSYLRLDTTNAADIVLHDKNGTLYHFLTGFTFASNELSPYFKAADTIIDSNGNVISINSVGGSSVQINSITDTLGRVVTFTYSPTLSTITYKDSNGATQNFTFSYSTVQLNYTFTNPPNSGSFNGILPRLSSIALPSGLTYSFTYNGVLGELNKITYPTGGYTRYDFATYTSLWRTAKPPNLSKVPSPQASDSRG